ADAVFLRAGHDLHTVTALVGDVFEILGGAGEVRAQRHRVPVEADEDEAAELLHTLDMDEVELAVVGGLGRQRLAARHADEAALLVEGPGVVAAGEGAAVARALAADQRAAMRTGVVERVQPVVAVAGEEQRPPADPAREEVAGLLQLRRMAEIEPA